MLKYLLLLNLALASCASVPENQATTGAQTPASKISAVHAGAKPDPVEGNLITIGEAEYLYVLEAEYAYDARIDTGATTCSIHAEDITVIERDGEQWARFNLVNFDTKERIERSEKIVRVVDIKQHGSESVSRYVVVLKVQFAGELRPFEFTLADRSNYSYPMLVGRNLLRGIALVDVSQSYTLPKVTAKPIAQIQAK